MGWVVTFAKFRCHNCSNEFIRDLPSSTIHNLNFASGIINSREYFLYLFNAPYLNDYYVCAKCGQLRTMDDVVEKNVHLSSPKDLDPKVLKVSKKSRMWILKELINGKVFSKYDERSLLLLYWAGVTDPSSALWLSDITKKGKVKEKADARNIERLLSLLDEKKPEERLLKIEILRSQNKFDEAEKLLDFNLSDKELQNILEKERLYISQKRASSFIARETPQIIY